MRPYGRTRATHVCRCCHSPNTGIVKSRARDEARRECEYDRRYERWLDEGEREMLTLDLALLNDDIATVASMMLPWREFWDNAEAYGRATS